MVEPVDLKRLLFCHIKGRCVGIIGSIATVTPALDVMPQEARWKRLRIEFEIVEALLNQAKLVVRVINRKRLGQANMFTKFTQKSYAGSMESSLSRDSIVKHQSTLRLARAFRAFYCKRHGAD